MKINAALNLVIPLYNEDNEVYAQVYSPPVSQASFEANFRLLVRTHETMMREGASAFRQATLFLKEAAAQIAGPENAAQVYMPLLNEINRTTIAAVATPQGWDAIPIQQAIEHGHVSAEDGREVMSAAVFFIAAWHVSPRWMLTDVIASGTKLWGAQTSSLPLTEWMASLPTSNATGNIGAPKPPLIPTLSDEVLRHGSAAISLQVS